MGSGLNIGEVLGPMVLAVVINAVLYGTCIVQWYNYYTSGYNDPLSTRLLVFWCVILDTWHTAITTYMLWDITVNHFGEQEIFTNLPWTFSATPFFSIVINSDLTKFARFAARLAPSQALASVPIQHFLAWRIKNLSHRWFWFFVVSALSLGQGACAFVGGVFASTMTRPNYTSLIPIAESWISVAVLTDVFVAGLLLYYLRKGKTGYQTSVDHVIGRLIMTVIETCTVGAVVCIADIIIFTTKPQTNLHFLFALPQGRIYTNTLMVTLNARASLREEMRTTRFNGVELPGNMSKLKCSAFSIGIPRTDPNIEIDQFSISSSSGRGSPAKDVSSIA